MKSFVTARKIGSAAAAAGLALLASCAQPPAPTSVAPPPVATIPPRPQPPMGAPAGMAIPPAQADGKRMTVNSNLSSSQTVWNLRSAYNVAALNCLDPEHAEILPGYAAFLKTHAKALTAVNSDLDKTFKAKHGSGYIRVRESYQTQVYNFFALPPVLPAMCNEALALAQDLKIVAPGQLEGFALGGLARLDGVYQSFYTSFDQYKADLSAWEARYGSGATVAAGSSSSQSLAQ